MLSLSEVDSSNMPPPNPMSCSYPECGYSTPVNIPSFELVIKSLDIHVRTAHGNEKVEQNGKVEKLKRPQISANMSEGDWTFFLHKWTRYVRQAHLREQQQVDELWACLDTDLERLAFNDGLNDNSSEELLKAIKKLAVTVLHPSVHVVNLHQLKQLEGETVKAFSAKVKGVAGNCNLTKKCPSAGCSENVSFVEETCFHVVMSGIADSDMKEKILTQAMLGVVKDLPSLLSYASAEESSRIKENTREIGAFHKKSAYKSKNGKCSFCGQAAHGIDNKFRRDQCKAFGKKCTKCGKQNHWASVCRSQKAAAIQPAQQQDGSPSDESDNEPSISGFISSIIQQFKVSTPESAVPVLQAVRSKISSPVNTLPVPHYVFDTYSEKWLKKQPKPSPTLTVSVSIDRNAYKQLKLNMPDLTKKPGAGHSRDRTATMDTGAQLTVVNVSELNALGIKLNSIFPLATTVNTVTKGSIDLVGGIFLRFSVCDPFTKIVRHTNQLCYVSKSVKGIYLSEEACEALGCISENFPTIGSCNAMEIKENVNSCKNTGVGQDNTAICACPNRTLPPPDKPELPCEPTQENLNKLRQYILDRYASSAFNCCENQPLPLMETAPPLRLFVDEQASPIAAMTPSAIPIHWAEDVKAGLDRDERLGVIEKVPVNEPVRWCSRMLITPKTDGTPRRVIDFSPINRNAPRQLHHTKSPHTIAMGVPGNTVKTVLDNWHGYHSVPIYEPDRPLTTFITPYGRYRYRTVPQGFISAGDGYTHRMDLIVEGTKNYDHCVDDSILWDATIEENFFKVCDFIEKCSRAGCVFNPKKFQFAQTEVDFLGFTITQSGLKPQQKFLDSIRTFPSPKCLTDVRSWFGLINQVSYAFAIAPHMAPFRHLLSSKLPFHWSEELEESFKKSKEEIIEQCEKGVRNFVPNAPTVLATDWSRAAVGCWLTQKVCNCEASLPGCCHDGWQTIHVASKFNSPAVSRYHPIEGEAFAASWALEKCKLFVLGHPNLTLAVDHKPLLAILGPCQELAEVINPRLMNFKLKSMAFQFKPVHIPGKKHIVPDTFSRRQDAPALTEPKLPTEPPVTSNVLPEYSNSFGPPAWVSQPGDLQSIQSEEDELYIGLTIAKLAGIKPSIEGCVDANQSNIRVITWNLLEQECQKCPQYGKLRECVVKGFPQHSEQWDNDMIPYRRVFRELTLLGPVVMLNSRPVIPQSLRREMLQHLHGCHSGVQNMIQRALSDVYWPNYKQDIVEYRNSCQSCNTYAPSNPPVHSSPEPSLPSYPFQVVCVDFFMWNRKNYLIVVDKYSNWLSIIQLTKDDSKQVIKALRQYFSVFGVCETLCSDGALVFTSNEMKQFCKIWGISQRISSAYYPQSNKRAEVGVKSAKRLIRENLASNGDLNTDKFARALLMHRNTPDPATHVSPAQIVYGHPIRDHIPRQSYAPREDWAKLASRREQCFMKRHFLKSEKLDMNAKKLKELQAGDTVYIQDQDGPSPRKWTKSGTILETLPHNSFLVKVDGSNKVTKRNRQFLRHYVPFSDLNKDTKQELRPEVSPHESTVISASMMIALDIADAPLTACSFYQ